MAFIFLTTSLFGLIASLGVVSMMRVVADYDSQLQADIDVVRPLFA